MPVSPITLTRAALAAEAVYLSEKPAPMTDAEVEEYIASLRRNSFAGRIRAWRERQEARKREAESRPWSGRPVFLCNLPGPEHLPINQEE